ncbi:MAG: hypothetical protein JW697_03405, partial [Kosmotogaceae bacterium]|nr:hypothetical protein [Kosmotogaceae bacterium]
FFPFILTPSLLFYPICSSIYLQYPCGVNMLFPEDGGPLTDNFVFISGRRIHVLKRAAGLEKPARLRGQWSRCDHVKIEIPTRSFVGMTESSLFGITVSCHPGLDPGSGSKNEHLDA